MTRITLNIFLMLVCVVGCSDVPLESIAYSQNENNPITTPSNFQTTNQSEEVVELPSEVVIMTNDDGTIQEEVVFLSQDVEFSVHVQEVEIPDIIVAALENAPDDVTLSSTFTNPEPINPPNSVSAILTTADGTQEEVVYLDSDEFPGDNVHTAQVVVFEPDGRHAS